MRLSLYVNLAILAAKAYVYIKTLSLAVLAALLDSLLDVVSQLVLYYTERTSDLRSSEIYPAGAARLAFTFSNIQN
jgi:divalent metal cation (Fe/Co/Zn/Cd) transporter